MKDKTRYHIYIWRREQWRWVRFKSFDDLTPALRELKKLDRYKRKIIEVRSRTVVAWNINHVVSETEAYRTAAKES